VSGVGEPGAVSVSLIKGDSQADKFYTWSPPYKGSKKGDTMSCDTE